jgi:hypothetical protein
MFPFDWSGVHKRRTRAHIIEELSLNYLERKVLGRGHQLVPASKREYGWDATMFHFSPGVGEIENGEVRFQLKATDHLNEAKSFVTCQIASKDLRYWYWEAQRLPFVLVLYDARRNRAFWVDIRSYIDDRQLDIEETQQQITVRIPAKNTVIDRFRKMSLSRIAREG